MNSTLQIFFFTIFSIACFSCNRTSVKTSNSDNIKVVSSEKSEALKQIENAIQSSHLVQKKQIGELEFTISYLPHEYLALKEISNDKIDPDLLSKYMDNYSEMAYFQIQISNPKGNTELLKEFLSEEGEYNQRLNYYSFDVKKDIQITQKESVTKCGISHFERNFDVVPHIRLLAAFEIKNLRLDEDIIFEFQDNVFNKGIIKVKFDQLSNLTLPNLEV
jgi:hypothetical protein